MSSGEEEDWGEEGAPAAEAAAPPPPIDDRPGANTGPKGVLADYADAAHKTRLMWDAQNNGGAPDFSPHIPPFLMLTR